MPIVELLLPKLGESIMEATILKWLKKPGDTVKKDESVLEIATDKVDSDVPSTATGIITELLYKENDLVPIGAAIAKISTEESIGFISQTKAEDNVVNDQNSSSQDVNRNEKTSMDSELKNSRFLSPAVMQLINEIGISFDELVNVEGSGMGGRITKKDIEKYMQKRMLSKTNHQSVEQNITIQSHPIVSKEEKKYAEIKDANVDIIEMDRMRKLIADHMVKSKSTAPHVTSFVEADVTNIVQWRDSIKDEFAMKYNEKLTLTPIFIKAVVNVIKKYPMINSSIDGNQIIIKHDVNIGMATALPNGNLIVPVIKNADNKNLFGITKVVNELAQKARQNQLKPDETQGGTFTVTNVGVFGSLMGTPIINIPQVAILAIGTIKKRPVVIETDEGDAIAIRQMINLSLSYDHRIVDGSLGASFLSQVAKEIEEFDMTTSI
ncbi:MAG: 2-oxo acid dehydrogenase subunit E2 [Chitinophagaceae bacterium]|nr:MAG: 2-oxo acid dehydrogenase subunit E2 [Chitinophagaceae bacterium]